MTDSHAHLDACDEPAFTLVARARRAGVERVVTIGTGIDSCRLEEPRRESNLHLALRTGLLYPLSYGDKFQYFSKLLNISKA